MKAVATESSTSTCAVDDNPRTGSAHFSAKSTPKVMASRSCGEREERSHAGPLTDGSGALDSGGLIRDRHVTPWRERVCESTPNVACKLSP